MRKYFDREGTIVAQGRERPRPDFGLVERGFVPGVEDDYKKLAAYVEAASWFGGGFQFRPSFDFIKAYPDGDRDLVHGDWIQIEDGRVIITIGDTDTGVGGFYRVSLEAEYKHNGQWYPVELSEDNLVEDIKAVLGIVGDPLIC